MRDKSGQLNIGSQLVDAIASQVVAWIKVSLTGQAISSDDEPVEKARRKIGKRRTGPKKRATSHKVEEGAILEYFKATGPASIMTMAKDLKLTLSMAHKRKVELLERKCLKRVKEGNRVLYLLTPQGERIRKAAAATPSE